MWSSLSLANGAGRLRARLQRSGLSGTLVVASHLCDGCRQSSTKAAGGGGQQQPATSNPASSRTVPSSSSTVTGSATAAPPSAAATGTRLTPASVPTAPQVKSQKLPGEDTGNTFRLRHMDIPTGAPQEVQGIWGKMRMQPINPQLQARPAYAPGEQKAASRKYAAANNVIDPRNMPKLADDQVESIMDRFAMKQWYAFFWKRVRWLPIDRLKLLQKWAKLGILITLSGMFTIMTYLFQLESELYYCMEPEDQRDYKKVVRGMRMGDVKKAAQEILDTADPLRVLPPKQQMTIIVKEFRARGLVDLDWELEQRKRRNMIRDPDIYHLFYWFVMYVGRALTGGAVSWWADDEDDIIVDPSGNVTTRAALNKVTKPLARLAGSAPTGTAL